MGSALGKALSMSTTSTWATVVSKLKAVANKGAWTGTISSSGGSVTVPEGYHNGNGKVTGPTLATLIGANVTATSNAHILSGYTAYGKNGVKYTGSDKGYAAGRASQALIKVNQSYYAAKSSWAETGNNWGSGTSEKLMTKAITYAAGYTKFEAVIVASGGDIYCRVRYINMTGSTSKTMLSSGAEKTDSRGGHDHHVGAYISGTVSSSGGTLTLTVSISRYSDADLVVGAILFK